MKKILISLCILGFVVPAYAENISNREALDYINSNPQFSGALNTASFKYPPLKNNVKSLSAADMLMEEAENEELSTPHEIKMNANSSKRPPMNYNSFPQNYDSSNAMMMMPGGIQNMMMPY